MAEVGRFSGADWLSPEDVIIGGAGGIGSHLAFQLNRAGFNVTLYDYDNFESHNSAGQLFSRKNIGQPKTFAVSELINDLSGSIINTFNEKYDESSMIHKYMFSGFDNMEARRIMFEKWAAVYGNIDDAIFIDGRM